MLILARASRLLITLLVAAVAIAVGLTPAVAQPGPRVTNEFLIGRWTDDGNCSSGVEFSRDGSFKTDDGVQGRWSLSGNQLSFIGRSTIVARISATDANNIVLTQADGSTGASTRCPSAAVAQRITMPPVPATAEEVLRMSTPATAAMMIGRWTDDGDCGSVIEFRRDGRFTVPTGGGTWTLNNELLTFTGTGTVTSRARAVGNDRILLLQADGSIGQSMRCR
jgi:hypothetical protein